MMLPALRFHHLHLSSLDPDSAIGFCLRQFPASAKTDWGGLPALAAPNDVLVLFSHVATAPATSPQTAIWHFGWHVTDTRASLESYKQRPDVALLPLYTTDEGGSVLVSSDTWPSAGRTPGWGDQPLASSRGHLYDHIALSVTDLDAWVTKLRSERVTLLEEHYKLGDARAVMIEGPSREALELVEAA